ncbi:PleD family two-component system response regulator [Acidobacteriota bacterium]
MAYKVIIADRSPSVRRAIQLVSLASEFEMFPFEDGLKVIESIDKINPDIILLNLSLVSIDGYEVGNYLKNHEKHKEIPLILLKGAFENLDNNKIAKLDYDGIVAEPFDSEELARMILETIEAKKAFQTFPEKPFFENITPSEWNKGLNEDMKDLIWKEVCNIERGLEKKIVAQVVAEIKKWIEDKNRD